MATYASATNPFIKPTGEESSKTGVKSVTGGGGNNDLEINSNKNAPGMPRQQSRKERKRARRRELQVGNSQPHATDQSQTKVKAHDTHDDKMDGQANGGGGGSLMEADDGQLAPIQDGAMPRAKVDANQNLLFDEPSDASELELASTDVGLEIANQLAEQVSKLAIKDEIMTGGEFLEKSPNGLANGYQRDSLAKTAADTLQDVIGGEVKLEEEEAEEDETCQHPDKQSNQAPGLTSDQHEPLGEKQEEAPAPERDSRRHQHIELIRKLRLQLRDLERYAYERGELDQAPPSVLAERQTVILDSLKRKLPLNIDEDRMEKLELEELKSQVDKEISELIDPLITKDHLLNQLKTQLIDLERYISHLHETLGKNIDKRALSDAACSCQAHGCSTPSHLASSSSLTFQSLGGCSLEHEQPASQSTNLMNNDTLPKTSRLIRGLMAQLICSDIKIQEAMRMEKNYSRYPGHPELKRTSSQGSNSSSSHNSSSTGAFAGSAAAAAAATVKAPQFHDTAVWNMHIDRVQLATDSLTNLFGMSSSGADNAQADKPAPEVERPTQVDESLVDSVVRRQLVPALRDLLAYGLIDPNSLPRPTYRSLLFDPYYLISSLTCLPGSRNSSAQDESLNNVTLDKIHAWNVIEDYFNAHNEPEFKTSSVKTLSQSFQLTPSLDGPIKVTSKQGLLIAVDDIIERLARCKPNGPESHFKLFVYTALNQGKLSTWIRIIFRSKSILRKFYHNFSFVSQPDKMDKFLHVIDALSQIKFKLNTDMGSTNQFVSAF